MTIIITTNGHIDSRACCYCLLIGQLEELELVWKVYRFFLCGIIIIPLDWMYIF